MGFVDSIPHSALLLGYMGVHIRIGDRKLSSYLDIIHNLEAENWTGREFIAA
jgi:hypothetical protein